MANQFRIIGCVVAGATLLILPTQAQTAPTDTLTLDAVYALVAARNPMLAAGRARVDALRSMERAAGLPPDPQLQLGVMNVSLPELSTNMPASMAPSIELMQMLPLPPKLARASDIARAQTAIARSDAAELGWTMRARAAAEYHTLYRIDRQIEEMRRTVDLLEHAEKVARSMYGAGEASQAEVLRASVEIARMEAEVARMSAMRIGAVARLNAVLDRPADTPVEAVAAPLATADLPALETLVEWASEFSPSIARGRTTVARAASQSDLARRELWPDITLGLQYGQRAGEMGTERMGSLMLGFTVPVFAGARQFRMRDEAEAMATMAAAELTAEVAETTGRIAAMAAEIESSARLAALYRSGVLPQAEAAATSALSAYRAGTIDFMAVLDAQMRLNEYRSELFALEAALGQALAELEMVVGREIPRTPTTREER